MKRGIAMVGLLTMLAAPAFSGGDNPDKVVEYRKASMTATARHMKQLGFLVKGDVNRPGDIAYHADAIAFAAKDLVSLYPEGTSPDALKGEVKSESKPEVWTKRADFEAAAKKFADETAKLAELAKGTDTAALGAQLDVVGKTCGGCHDTFKVKH